ncbi:hypothetical protein HBH53_078990 [Parastagonospora nodorum]|nr:hypothetical protein HBH53_078990 [Parastagonospora nodorum]KAH3982810.1 hypothetical protein HBH51_036760 [Parastagonospora nodorum]KAH4968114.1 hypothetical protein HBI78_064640 [Parastagonospora nodorum]KAH5201840.1 hypothetical protein HBH77_122180 [Parastagonospora nodorum]KAH5724852.1 hypothetical protein HBI18_127030 [Parastagonospora nodorum]
MTPTLHHECTRLPVTALASCGALLVAAEGPFLRFYDAKSSRYIASKRVFKAHAVHGISVYSETYDDVIKLVVWGGCLVRALEVKFTPRVDFHETQLDACLSAVARSPDWILDLAPRFSSLEDASEIEQGICVAVTAHNALVQVTIHRQRKEIEPEKAFALSLSELTSSSRSILYSAHVFWESENCVLVAAGTAFGEIMYWSWNQDADAGSNSRVHRVFLGHEGSIFGVRISKELPSGCCQTLKRIIASCSDDRTIRIWDVSDVAVHDSHRVTSVPVKDSERTQHTGFSNAAFDPNSFSSSQCLAIGWGHASRVWNVQFLESTPCEGALLLVSTGEDASSRTWKLTLDKNEGAILPYQLLQQDSAAHHSGKNMWSSAIYGEPVRRQHVVCGAADSKITSHPLVRVSEKSRESRVQEYTMPDILALAQMLTQQPNQTTVQRNRMSSKRADFLRSYSFLDHESFLLTTNSGNILLGSLRSRKNSGGPSGLAGATFIDQLDDLCGYSVCKGDTNAGVAFVGGSTGVVYMYIKATNRLSKVESFDAKIGEMFVTNVAHIDKRITVALLVTLVGMQEAQLLFVEVAADSKPCVTRAVTVPLSDLPIGSMVTSVTLTSSFGAMFLHLGFRRGSIVVYSIPGGESEDSNRVKSFRAIDKVHGEETVTSLHWTTSPQDTFVGYLASVGRDGCLAIHLLDLHANVFKLVHNSTLPIGPNIEGLFFQHGHLLVHGFSSKKWVLYDVTSEDEIMGIETGGAHRSWAFQPDQGAQGGGSLVWTRASSLHIRSQTGPNHNVIRSGGHGREIKAVAASQGAHGQLIATGAEDTDIKIFQYVAGELHCQRTLRKHTTGIQHLQWSDDGEYLFSSGGCEEFYIWRINHLPLAFGAGVVCEFIYTPESEHADLRIMSFDVHKRGLEYDIAMVFSDSSIKVYKYNPLRVDVRWQAIAQGLYFTSCLTQCVFLDTESLLTVGTDGHTAIWPLSSEGTRPTADSKTQTLSWQQPVRIHQSSSKAMASHQHDASTKLIVSGGDDGSTAIMLLSTTSFKKTYAAAPVLLNRTHASAVTACAIMQQGERTFIVTSGNDQWLRLWEVSVCDQEGDIRTPAGNTYDKSISDVRRLGKIKTNVADVSSIAVLEAHQEEGVARVLVCGVGMEVIRLEWDVNNGT